MLPLLNILAQTTSDAAETPAPPSQVELDPGTIVFCTVGMCILVAWLFWFGGFGALRQAPVRRHRQVFLYWPPAILAFWILNMLGIQLLISALIGTESDTQQSIITYCVNLVLEIGLIVLMLIVASKLFARGIKGFGFLQGSFIKDAIMAVVNLLGVFPLVFGGLALTLVLGQLFSGPDFTLQVHQSLEVLTDAGTGLKIMIILFAVVVVPVFEELLFRGFVQTSLRSVSGRPWTAIVATSIFFAILHPPTHILALFMLSCGLGYAYERSGSLTRPILMHILFNGVNVAATLLIQS